MQAHGTKQIVAEHFVLTAVLYGAIVAGLTLVITLGATGNLSFGGQSSNEAASSGAAQQAAEVVQPALNAAAGVGNTRVDDALVAQRFGPGEGLTGYDAPEAAVAQEIARPAAVDQRPLVIGPGEGMNTDLAVPAAGASRAEGVFGPGEGMNSLPVGTVSATASGEERIFKGPGEGFASY